MGLVNLAHPELMTPAAAQAVVLVLFAAGVTAMTAIAFIIWFAWVVVKGVLMVTSRLFLGSGRHLPQVDAGPRTGPCPDPMCRSINPVHAHFCRQCGRMLKARDLA